MAELLYILFGWILGLASPLLLDYFREKKERKYFLRAVVAELHDLQYIIAGNVFILETKHGTLNVPTLKMLGDIIDKYHGSEPIGPLRDSLDKLRAVPEDKFDAAVAALPRTEQTVSSLKAIEPRYLLANLSELSKLSENLQLGFYALLRRLSVVNQEIPKIDALVRMTFDSSISGDNYEGVLSDIKRRYVFAAGQYRSALATIEGINAEVKKFGLEGLAD